ncbi:MAG TPA: PAS domain-containing protein, partial [Aggregatilineaceae bacterium]|nr:PAS domain-containing protein [Aggregatilineaceae bacterium]
MHRHRGLKYLTGLPAAHGPKHHQAAPQLFPGLGQDERRSSGRPLACVWCWLTEPADTIKDPGLRRQARLLSSLLTVLVLGGLVLGIIPYLIFYGQPDRLFYVLVASVEALAFLYLLSRSRHYTAAATLTVISTSAGAFCAAALGKGPPETDLLVYLVIPVVLSSILLSTGATITLLGVQVMGMVGFQEYYAVAPQESWIGFVVIVSLLVMLATHHWAKVERDRSAAFTTERNLLRTVIDHAPDCVYVKDTEGRLVLQNTAVVRLLGARSHEELTGKTAFDLYPSELAARYQADEETVMRSGFALANHEEPLIDAKGCHRWLLTTRVPLHDSNGQIIGLVGIGRDITERKQSEDALARYNQRLDVLHTLDQSVLAGMSAEEIGHQAIQHLATLLPCSYASIVLFDPQAGTERILIEWCPDGMPCDEELPSTALTGSPATRESMRLLVRDTAASDSSAWH